MKDSHFKSTIARMTDVLYRNVPPNNPRIFLLFRWQLGRNEEVSNTCFHEDLYALSSNFVCM